MTAVPRRKILFLLSSNGLKSRIVLEHLLGDDWFVDKFDLGVVVDRSEGEITQPLSKSNVRYEVASSPQSPSEEVIDVFPDRPDYIISVGWSHYIPPETIELASIEALNCHGSYLPDYRGPNAYRSMWANGCGTGGASVHVLTDEFDGGRIIRREHFDIAPLDTPREIGYKASELTAGLVRESILLIESGYEGIKNEGGSYYERISWPRTIVHGAINNLARLTSVSWRWKIGPR